MSLGWDNRVINVNGRGLRMLERAIELACDTGQSEKPSGLKVDRDATQIVGSIVDPKCGLIWLWAICDGAAKYPAPLTPKQAAEITFQWLQSADATAIPCEGWDTNADHDGDNERGWRAYVGDWGGVGKASWHTVIAIRPAYLWYGK